MSPSAGRCMSSHLYGVFSFQPSFRGSCHNSLACPGVSPECHSALRRNSPGPVSEFIAFSWMAGCATARNGVDCQYVCVFFFHMTA